MKKYLVAIPLLLLILLFFLTQPTHQQRMFTATPGQPLVIELPDGARATAPLPAGMQRDGNTLRWSPTPDQHGNHTFTFAWGFPRESQLTLRVEVAAAPPVPPPPVEPPAPAPLAVAPLPSKPQPKPPPERKTLPAGVTVNPQFLTAPSLRIKAGQEWAYQPQVDVMEGRTPSFRLHKGPPGMVLDEDTNTLRWTPPIDFVGEANVYLNVWDKVKEHAYQEFNLSTESIFKIGAYGDWPQTLLPLPDGLLLGVSQARLMLIAGDMREVRASYWLPDRSQRTFNYYKGFVYLGTELDGIYVFDVRDGKSIVPCARLSTTNRGSHHNAISDDILIVAGRDYALYFYSLGDPGNPVQLSRLYMGVNKNTYSVHTVGRIAYVHGHKYMAAVDFKDPSKPFRLSEVEISTDGVFGAFVVAPPYLYQFGSERVIVDATRPEKLTLVKASKEGDPWICHGVVMDKTILLYGKEGVSKLDLTDPIAPRKIESFSSNGQQLGAGPDGLYQTTTEGRIVPVKDRASLEKNRNSAGHGYQALASNGSTVYAVGTTLDILDASAPTNPRLISRTRFTGNASDPKAHFVDGVLFTSLGIFDVRSSKEPRLIQAISNVRALTADGRTVYTAVGSEVTQWKVNDGAVTRLSQWKVDESFQCMAVKGDRLYAGIKPYHLYTYKITPEKLELLDSKVATRYEKNAEIKDIKIEGDYLYCALNSVGIACNSIQNPDKPEWFSHVVTGQYAINMVVRDGRMYVAEGSGGVKIIERGEPGKAKIICGYETTDWTTAITLVNDFIAAADRETGIQFFASELLTGKATPQKFKIQPEAVPATLPKSPGTTQDF